MTDSTDDIYDSMDIPEAEPEAGPTSAEDEINAFFDDRENEEVASDMYVSEEEMAELEEDADEVVEDTEESSDLISIEGNASAEKSGIKLFDKSGKEVVMPEDAEIEVKIDGEIHRVKLSDFRNDLSGQKAISQRFSLLDAEKKEVTQRKQALDAAEGHVGNLMKQGKVVEAMDFVFEAMGYNNNEILGKFFDQIASPLQNYMSMSPEQQQQWALKAQAERTKLELEKTKASHAQLQAQQAQLLEVRRVQSDLGLDDATFAQRYHELQEEMRMGAIQPQNITADLVGNYAVLRDRQDWASEALEKVRPDLSKNLDVIDDILRVVIRQYDKAGADFTREDMNAIITQAYGAPSKKPKATEIRSALEKKGNPVVKQIPQSKPKAPLRGQPKQTQQQKGTNFLDTLSNASPKQLKKMIDKWST